MKQVMKMKKIIIVEDDERLREELKILLENNGYEARILRTFDLRQTR